MATMTPVVLLVVFCATMTAITIGRLLRGDDRDPVDVGTVLVLVAITMLAVAWVGFEERSAVTTEILLLTGSAIVVLVGGIAVASYYWDDSTAATAAESGETRDDGDLECPET